MTNGELKQLMEMEYQVLKWRLIALFFFCCFITVFVVHYLEVGL